MSANNNGHGVALDFSPEPVVTYDCIADDLLIFFRRFIFAGNAELTALSLWTLHTHAFSGVTSFTPYLSITSAEKGSGKTRVLEVLHGVVRQPLMTASISPAALARIVDKEHPTMLLDELDALLKGDKEMSEALRGILNSGFNAKGNYTRMAGTGASMHPEQYSTFCPKALAGIGTLPDTVSARSITLRLQRAERGSRESFRPDGMGRASKALGRELEELRKRSEAWAGRHTKKLADAEPLCPSAFLDRQRDIAEPLLAIADLLGGEWPTKAREALLALFTSQAAEDTSTGVRLLSDIKQIFGEAAEKFTSGELVEKLVEIETSPWAEWRHGKPMTTNGLARQLKTFGIFPRTIRAEGGSIVRGYARESFLKDWDTYVAPCSGSFVAVESAISPNIHAGCSSVAVEKGGASQGGVKRAVSGLPGCGQCGSTAMYRLAAGGSVCQSCGAAGETLQ
jgi:hypothetical protein